MTNLTRREAEEIIKEYGNSLYILDDVHPNTKAYFIAEGFLSGLKAEEENSKRIIRSLRECSDFQESKIKILTEALFEIRNQNPIENALDPQWAARIAKNALDIIDRRKEQ